MTNLQNFHLRAVIDALLLKFVSFFRLKYLQCHSLRVILFPERKIMVATPRTTRSKKLTKYSKFLQELRSSFSRHWTYDELWALLLGDTLPSKHQQQVLLAHFRSHGWNVSPRDFIRGTAASNHPVFINLRLLRHSLSRSELDILFFAGNYKKS